MYTHPYVSYTTAALCPSVPIDVYQRSTAVFDAFSTYGCPSIPIYTCLILLLPYAHLYLSMSIYEVPLHSMPSLPTDVHLYLSILGYFVSARGWTSV